MANENMLPADIERIKSFQVTRFKVVFSCFREKWIAGLDGTNELVEEYYTG